MKKILFIYGTRPEAIKMAPLIHIFKTQGSDCFDTEVCLTGQHRQMLDQVNRFFGIESNYDLDLMQPNQDLFGITARCLVGMKDVLEKSKPDLVFVQGDTTSVLAGALAAFYMKIPVAHLEAGLRSDDLYSPYPEEANRTLVGHLAAWHFAPTDSAVKNLARENVHKNVHEVGNTVIDALYLGLNIIEKTDETVFQKHFTDVDFSKKIILVTGHRRESFGEGFVNICNAIKVLAEKYSDTVEFVYPVHLNPNVREPVFKTLGNLGNVHLIEPIDYPFLIWIMKRSYLVLTDSGGIQEEAPSLGKPVLVMRDVTERMEGVNAGTARLVGTGFNRIVGNVTELLENTAVYDKMSKAVNPYGDGTASIKILQILKNGLQ
jgi:UDP-N-acetylglucosamine 2-epimerase (non-hydrolysing)